MVVGIVIGSGVFFKAGDEILAAGDDAPSYSSKLKLLFCFFED